MKKIRTVQGDIAPEELGLTSMHDHTFLDLSVAGQFMKNMFPGVTDEMVAFVPENYGFLKSGTYLMSKELQIIDDMDYLVKEYGYFKAVGGRSVVDPGPIGIRGRGDRLKEFSRITGLNIICATGVYTAISRPAELLGKDEEVLYQTFKKEIEEGIDGTDVKPGILKAAIATYGSNGILNAEIDGVRACARLSAETGMSLHIHTDPTLPAASVVNVIKMVIEDCGVDAGRILVCHTDSRLACSVQMDDYLQTMETGRNINLDMHKELLDLGVNIGFDTWGMPITNPQFFAADDYDRVKGLITLIDLGYASQITLGNDFSSKMASRSYGGYGCTRFIEYGMSMLQKYGRGDAVAKLTVENPARILAY